MDANVVQMDWIEFHKYNKVHWLMKEGKTENGINYNSDLMRNKRKKKNDNKTNKDKLT